MLPEGRIAALEVTRHTVAAEIEGRAAAAKLTWRFAVLRYDWVVDMAGQYSVRQVHRRAPSLLAIIEAAGIETFDLKYGTPAGPAEKALLTLRTLGGRLLYRLGEAPHGGQIILGAAPVGGSTAADVLVEVAERHGNLADNARKLASAHGDERHLFVWVEGGHHQAVAAMAFEVLPRRAPQLPEHLDVAWLATAYNVSQVWRFARRSGWEDLGTRRLDWS